MRAPLLSSLSLALVALLVSACPPGGGTVGEGEGEPEVLDGGPDPEGEGEGEEGEGEEGEGEGEEGEGEGEGEVQGTPYSGTAEDGVVCGDATCVDPTASCCVAIFGGQSTCGAPGECAQGTVEAGCDGPEDCEAAQECCFAGTSTQCVAVDTCRDDPNNREICVTDADCLGTELCCSDEILATVGVDGGICLPAEDNCAGQFNQP